MKTELVRISAKTLGELALADFCPRCFWIKRNVRTLPYQVFPSVFNDFDKLTKNYVHKHIDERKTLPPWLSSLGTIEGYIEPPNFKKLSLEIDNIIFSGSPDDIFIQNGELIVVDYKTARYTDGQDRLFPMYDVQLNSYAYLLEKCNYGKVSRLAAVYMQPMENSIDLKIGLNITLEAYIVKVNLNTSKIEEMIKRASNLVYGEVPVCNDKCKNCKAVIKLGEIKA